MNNKHTPWLTSWALCVVALALNTHTAPAVGPEPEAKGLGPSSATTSEAIPWSQIGAKAGAAYRGDGLAVTPTESGARLRCTLQRLEAEVTGEGLWLTSTVGDTPHVRFQVKATAIGRGSAKGLMLPPNGKVSRTDKLVTFTRPGLVEEYSVSVDGVRQDFVVLERPAGGGELQVCLEVAGARVETAACGAELVLDASGRKIAYSQLRVTDATGKELPARMEVVSGMEGSWWRAAAPIVALMVNDAEAVYPVRLDPTFSDANWISMGNIPGTDRTVYAAAVDGSGNLYIGGLFTVVDDIPANCVAKWDGSKWSALGSGCSGRVRALAVSGTDLYVGGRFTTAGGIPANNIAKWDGSTWSALGSGVSGDVQALAVSGSNLYAGGSRPQVALPNGEPDCQLGRDPWSPGFRESAAQSQPLRYREMTCMQESVLRPTRAAARTANRSPNGTGALGRPSGRG